MTLSSQRGAVAFLTQGTTSSSNALAGGGCIKGTSANEGCNTRRGTNIALGRRVQPDGSIRTRENNFPQDWRDQKKKTSALTPAARRRPGQKRRNQYGGRLKAVRARSTRKPCPRPPQGTCAPSGGVLVVTTEGDVIRGQRCCETPYCR